MSACCEMVRDTAPSSITPRQARVQQIDFRRPTKFPREAIRRPEHAHESFSRTASSGLSAELRTSLVLSVAGSELLPYGTAMTEANPESLLAVLATMVEQVAVRGRGKRRACGW